MDNAMMRVKPYKGRWCPRAIADQIRDRLAISDKVPDRTALERESREFEVEIARRRKSSAMMYDTH